MEEYTAYNLEKERLSKQIPLEIQSKLFQHVVEINIPKNIENKGMFWNKSYISTSNYYNLNIILNITETDETVIHIPLAKIMITLKDKKNKIVYQFEITIKKIGNDFKWGLHGYSQEKFPFFKKLLGEYFYYLYNNKK